MSVFQKVHAKCNPKVSLFGNKNILNLCMFFIDYTSLALSEEHPYRGDMEIAF